MLQAIKPTFSDPQLLAEIKTHTKLKRIEKDETLIRSGDKIVFVPLVQKGVLRIVREDADGREIFLYHLYAGQSCAMSLNCCQAGKESMVKAVAEDTTEVLLIPVGMVSEWFRYTEWKSFINGTYSNRFVELLNVIDLIAFSNMDKQLLRYLQARAQANNTHRLDITHQQIADELHTHREAISRLLRTMEQKNLVRLGRNSIELLHGL
ncbi:CRP/FNR family transcriptional regulator, anaerobic regulatory protein [Flexibacter flexilis DSM 6793]|uniref:CRP/FNR family transcriptional regulator, anaerobic regulatory protein n=1 Tax=Flexibacter flexilis DSM 6793 TaxID=927664 RepID=A0A1I1I614_9BACT|nr:Crp/Fnr family transcriptional regulator [Flexibacter flexilis]SFC31465.1 CRP/FNR family transcriptional regulator, anaerobic regulatory protein [Flexibacter flexilis DSM 6793]